MKLKENKQIQLNQKKEQLQQLMNEVHECEELANRMTSEYVVNWNQEPLSLTANELSSKDLERKLVITIQTWKEEKELIELQFHGKDCHDVEASYQKAFHDFQTTKQVFQAFQDNLQNLNLDFKERFRKWKKLRLEMSKSVNSFFDIYLQKKGFSVSVKFDFEKNTLSLICLFP